MLTICTFYILCGEVHICDLITSSDTQASYQPSLPAVVIKPAVLLSISHINMALFIFRDANLINVILLDKMLLLIVTLSG